MKVLMGYRGCFSNFAVIFEGIILIIWKGEGVTFFGLLRMLRAGGVIVIITSMGLGFIEVLSN